MSSWGLLCRSSRWRLRTGVPYTRYVVYSFKSSLLMLLYMQEAKALGLTTEYVLFNDMAWHAINECALVQVRS